MQITRSTALGTTLVMFVVVTVGIACNKAESGGASSSDPGTDQTVATTSSPATKESTDQPSTSAGKPDSDSQMPLIERPVKQAIVPSASGITLSPVDAEGLKATINKHQGKVVLVDCWATWCGPCTEQFPHTVELARNHANDLAVISISFDEPDQTQPVVEFLEKQGAKFDNLISKSGPSLESFVSFEIEGGALPFYKLYDRSGKLRYQFCGDNTGLENVLKIDELDTRVAELLAEKS